MILSGLIRASLRDKPANEGNTIDELRLFGDIPSQGMTPSMLELMFHFAMEAGLVYGALNLLNAIGLDRNLRSNRAFENAIFAGIMLTSRNIHKHVDCHELSW